jgi:hypothetical protein
MRGISACFLSPITILADWSGKYAKRKWCSFSGLDDLPLDNAFCSRNWSGEYDLGAFFSIPVWMALSEFF